MTVYDIYRIINRDVPFMSAEEWDNCGLLVGDINAPADIILTALDITVPVIEEAHAIGATLIISHHPVIFSPLKSVRADSPVGLMLKYGISAICTHTPFDMAPCGMNKGLYDLLRTPLGLSPIEESQPLEYHGNNMSIGMIYDLDEPLSAEECAKRLKDALGCTVVRYTDGGKPISSAIIVSGSGNSFIPHAAADGTALISGDFKHSSFIDAVNAGISVFDCGHFHTERIFCSLMADLLRDSGAEVIAASACTDPVQYV
ncbi:MAG: Nif3-like dinuclear metal center hexameric protein [Oscillospiraceae bacterium]|nr:Nif3-like dinuclear metal center hexameric protein [Oscillospiraceae bacterium]